MVYRFKMAAKKLPIFISRHFDFGQNLKNHFPKGIFQWNLRLKVGRTWIDLHYWNNILKKYIPFQNGSHNNFLIGLLHNNANTNCQ